MLTRNYMFVKRLGNPNTSEAAQTFIAAIAEDCEAALLKAQQARAQAKTSFIGEALTRELARIAKTLATEIAAIEKRVASGPGQASKNLTSTLATGIRKALVPSDNPREIALRAEIRAHLQAMEPLSRKNAIERAARDGDQTTLCACGEVVGTPLELVPLKEGSALHPDFNLIALRDTCAATINPEAAAMRDEADELVGSATHTLRRVIDAAKEFGVDIAARSFLEASGG